MNFISRFKQLPIAVLALAGMALSATSAHATLTNVGNGTVQDSSLNVVWTQDANLFQTLAASTPHLVLNIINNVGGEVTDSAGTHFLNGTDFDTSAGTLDWYGAQAFVSYLNSTAYAGHSNWSLPTIAPLNGSTYNTSLSYNGGTDVGYNNASSKSQLGHLFYASLGNQGFYDAAGQTQAPYGVSNAGPFTHLDSAGYWSGSEADADNAYFFSTLDGLQSAYDKTTQYKVLAVAAVPEPSALLMASAGLLMVVAMVRRAGR